MKKTFLIAKYELITLMRRRTYLFMAFGVPLLGLLVFFVISVVRGDNEGPVFPSDSLEETELKVEGFVDYADIISSLPEDVSPQHLLTFSDTDQADLA
ncbi:MAG: hypothetical protein V3V44_00730, partial [Anaerolineales bacterium]